MKLASTLVAALSLSLVACGSASSQSAHSTPATAAAEPAPSASAEAPTDDIVDIAVANGQFQTLVAAVEAAGLVDALKSDGPLTVFAPTDAAFAKLPEGTVEALLADTAKLQAVLKYHVVSGAVMAEDAAKLNAAPTLQGGEISINATDGVRINDAKVVMADIRASNGIIHVIDTVLIPQ